MREILFRGKMLDGNKWVYGYYLQSVAENPDSADMIISSDLASGWRIDKDTAGQFTGLTDNNGKRIFEGDIVKNSDGIYVVKYCECLTRFALVKDSLMSARPVSSGTVIGNIHDNPEIRSDEK